MAEPTWTTVADAKTHPAIGAGHADADVGRVLAAVEQRIEGPKATGVAWVPRETVEQVAGTGSRTVRLSRVRCRELVAVTVDGSAVDDLSAWTLTAAGRLTGPRTLKRGAVVDVTYRHGADAPPGDLLDAALRATGTLLGHDRNPRIGERTQSLVAEGQTINFAALPDAERGRTFGMPDVDAVVEGHAGEQQPAIA